MKKTAIQNKTKDFIEDECLAFFQFFYAQFKKAERNSKIIHDRYLDVGGQAIHLHFAGNGLNKVLVPAFTHLETPPVENPDLTILLWDSKTTKTEMPRIITRYFEILGEWWLNLGIRGEIEELSNAHIRTAYHLGPNIFSILDLERNLAIYWVNDAYALPFYELSSPLKTIFHWWTNSHGLQLVHGGAVGTSEGGVLIAGKGGTGKSTTTLACLSSGMQYAADDYCLIKTEPIPYVFSLYNTAKLRTDKDVERFPNLAPLVSNKDREVDEKALFYLYDYFPDKISSGFPLKAILLPILGNNMETRLKPTSAGSILRSLAPSTLLQLPGAGKSDIQSLSKLVRKVPGYIIELGSDLSQINEAVKSAIGGV